MQSYSEVLDVRASTHGFEEDTLQLITELCVYSPVAGGKIHFNQGHSYVAQVYIFLVSYTGPGWASGNCEGQMVHVP